MAGTWILTYLGNQSPRFDSFDEAVAYAVSHNHALYFTCFSEGPPMPRDDYHTLLDDALVLAREILHEQMLLDAVASDSCPPMHDQPVLEAARRIVARVEGRLCPKPTA